MPAGCREPGSALVQPFAADDFLYKLMMTDIQLITSGERSYFNFQSLSC